MQLVMSSDDGRTSRRSWTNFVFVSLTLALTSLAMACSDPAKPAATTGGEGGESGTSSSSGGGGGAGGGGGSGGGMVDMPGPVEEVLKFEWVMGELPEGIAIDGTTAYITFGSTQVIKVDLVTKTRSDYGSVPAPIGVGTPQGIALDGNKNVFVAVSSVDPVQFKPGIYKFPAGGGSATLFAQHVNMSFPRHIAFADSGLMVVSTPPSARMFTVSKAGIVSDPGVAEVLSGDQASACAYGEGIPYGISSVVLDGNSLYGANADRGQIIEGALQDDGNGGMVATPNQMNAILAGPDCATMGGAESIIIDPYDQGSTPFDIAMLVAARKQNKITKIRYTGGITTIADGTNLYEPSAMALAVMDGSRYLYIVNSARTTYDKGGIPGLVRMRLGAAK
jgi:hypothetical protein